MNPFRKNCSQIVFESLTKMTCKYVEGAADLSHFFMLQKSFKYDVSKNLEDNKNFEGAFKTFYILKQSQIKKFWLAWSTGTMS